ncbi:MAG: hypothetical protein LBP64_07525, partial [Tannerella sp.]|nr:hypothetical protein [Tannerella sp.]
DRERETFSHSLSMMASSRDEAEFKIRNELEPIIAEKDAIITEKDAVIARERAEKEALLAELAALKNSK